MEVQDLSETCRSLFSAEELMAISMSKLFFTRGKTEKMPQTEDLETRL